MTYKELSPLEKASKKISMIVELNNNDGIKLSYDKKPSLSIIEGDAEIFYNGFTDSIVYLYVFDEYSEEILFNFLP